MTLWYPVKIGGNKFAEVLMGRDMRLSRCGLNLVSAYQTAEMIFFRCTRKWVEPSKRLMTDPATGALVHTPEYRPIVERSLWRERRVALFAHKVRALELKLRILAIDLRYLALNVRQARLRLLRQLIRYRNKLLGGS